MKESDLCAAFIASIPKGWTAYSETGGFDILLVRAADGAQIGIEAKLVLNVKVITQALPSNSYWHDIGPDFRAVLVPHGKVQAGLATICERFGITVISYRVPEEGERHGYIYRHATRFTPPLPDTHDSFRHWHEWAPVRRVALPDYVPDVAAGSSAPVQLTSWKIKAIKLAILMETRPITRSDFKALQIDPSRWTDPWTEWLTKTPEGYVPGPRIPDFAAMHPLNYQQIKADRGKWEHPVSPAKPVQLALSVPG